MVYNFDTKEKFIDSLSVKTTKKFAKDFFRFSEQKEEELDKDCALFTNEEIVEVLEESVVYNPRSLASIIAAVREYKIWYNDNVDHCETSRLTTKLANEVSIERIVSSKLFMSLDDLLDEVDDGSYRVGYHHVIAFILRWYGFTVSAACQVKKKDVTFSKGNVKISKDDKVVTIDNRRAADILMEYYSLRTIEKSFDVNDITYVEDNDIYLIRPFSNPDRINIRGAKEKPYTQYAIMSQIRNFNDKRDRKVSLETVELSGDLYFIYDLCQTGMTIEEAIKLKNGYARQEDIACKKVLLEAYAKFKNNNC